MKKTRTYTVDDEIVVLRRDEKTIYGSEVKPLRQTWTHKLPEESHLFLSSSVATPSLRVVR